MGTPSVSQGTWILREAVTPFRVQSPPKRGGGGFPPNRKAFHISGDFIGRVGGPTTPQGGGGESQFQSIHKRNPPATPHKNGGGGTAALGSYTLYTPTYPYRYAHVPQDLLYPCIALHARTRPPKVPKP